MKIRVKNLSQFNIIYILLYVLALFVMIFNYSDTPIMGFRASLVTNILVIIFIGCGSLYTLRNEGIIKWDSLFLFFLFFVLFCLFTAPISYAVDDSLSRVRRLSVEFLLMISIYQFVDSKEKLYNSLKTLSWAGFTAAGYLLLASDLSSRIGDIAGDANQEGILCALLATVSLFLWKNKYGLFYILHFVILATAVLFTGSRTAFILLVVLIIANIYIAAYQQKWRLRTIIAMSLFIVSLIIAGFNLIMKSKVLYDILGIRLLSMYQILNGQQSVYHESSADIRGIFARRAFEWFLDSPIIGHGINSFASYNTTFAGGWYCFSHCDYVELLSGVGLIGTFLFFIPFVIMLIKQDRQYKSKSSTELKVLLITLILEFLIGEVFLVMHYEKMIWIFIPILVSAYRNANKEDFSMKYDK